MIVLGDGGGVFYLLGVGNCVYEVVALGVDDALGGG